MTLFKNGNEIIHGLKRKTYLLALEGIKRKAFNENKPVSMIGHGKDLCIMIGDDRYVLRGAK